MKKALLVLFLSFLPGLLLLYMCYWFFCGPYEVKKIKCAKDYAYTETSYNPISGCWYWNEHILKMTNVFDCSYREDFYTLNPTEIREQIDQFYYIAQEYEEDVKKAYGLDDAYDFSKEGSFGRLADVITSRILGTFPGTVDEGRTGMSVIRPLYAFICSKQFQSAYHAVTGAQAHYPKDPDSPYDVLSQIKITKYELENLHGWQPSVKYKKNSQKKTPEETQKDIDEYESLLKKYGYK